jgi:glycosyltransferase involved in cell wall biosynthesis
MISAIVLSKNNGDTLDFCLSSVVNSLPKDKEVIVVDGNSTDNTPRILAKYAGRVKVVYDGGKGLGRARNIGVKNATHDLIAFVDSDVLCARDHFLRFLEYFRAHPDIAGLDTDGIHPQTGSKVQRLESMLGESYDKRSGQSTLRGWCIAFRRSAFDAVGGFWRDGSDDTEFSYKLMAKGYKMATVKTGSWHVERSTMRSFLKQMKLWGRTYAHFVHKWGNTPTFIEEQKKKKLFKVAHNARVFVSVAYAVAPLTGLKYLVATHKPSLYAHFIVRQYAFFIGYLQGNLSIAFRGGAF